MILFVQVNLNRWCIDGTNLPEEPGPYSYLSPAIEQAFIDAYNDWRGILKWLYYSNEQGIMFNMPGFRASKVPGGFDPRLRWVPNFANP